MPTAWVSEPGEFATCHAGLVPIVVVRDHDGRLNGFVNICRHRATEVAQGRGKRETLQCPYHAWTYGLDGGLRAAPRSDREPGFDAAELLPGQGRRRHVGPVCVREPRPRQRAAR